MKAPDISIDSTDGSSQEDFDRLGIKLIPWDLHNALLEESIQEYREIWRELAKK